MKHSHGTPSAETVKKIFKEAGIDTRNLVSNKNRYGTSFLVFSYEGSSAWYAEYHWRSGHITINTKYNDYPQSVNEYNSALPDRYASNTISETLDYPYGK